MMRILFVFLLVVAWAASGCDADLPTDCVPATIVSCMCSDDGVIRTGTTECQESGAFGPCACMGVGSPPDSGATNRPEPDSGVFLGQDIIPFDSGETMTSTGSDAGLVDTGMTMTATDADAGIPDMGGADSGAGTSTASDASMADTGTSTSSDAG